MAIVRWEPFSLRPWNRFPLWEDGEWGLEGSDSLNLYETDNDIVAEANVPGIPEKDIEVNVEGGVLTIRGEMKQEDEEKEKGKQYYKKMERRSFHYATTLPRAIKAEQALAEIENGVVKVTIPKAEAEKPKRIEVKTKK